MGTNSYTAADFIEHIPGTGGIIAVIARRVGCTWTTAKKYVTKYATVRRAYEDECEAVSDMAESVVLKAIKEGDLAAAKWWLSRIRRDKFATHQETTITDNSQLTVTHQFEAALKRAYDSSKPISDDGDGGGLPSRSDTELQGG